MTRHIKSESPAVISKRSASHSRNKSFDFHFVSTYIPLLVSLEVACNGNTIHLGLYRKYILVRHPVVMKIHKVRMKVRTTFYYITLMCDMFWRMYKTPPSSKIRLPNKSYHVNYINCLFLSVSIYWSTTS